MLLKKLNNLSGKTTLVGGCLALRSTLEPTKSLSVTDFGINEKFITYDQFLY